MFERRGEEIPLTGRKIIIANDSISILQKAIYKIASNEPGTAGNKIVQESFLSTMQACVCDQQRTGNKNRFPCLQFQIHGRVEKGFSFDQENGQEHGKTLYKGGSKYRADDTLPWPKPTQELDRFCDRRFIPCICKTNDTAICSCFNLTSIISFSRRLYCQLPWQECTCWWASLTIVPRHLVQKYA